MHAFNVEFYPPTSRQSKKLEFKRLIQSNMTVTKYVRKFRELSEFAPYMILDKSTKRQRFLDKLNEDIALCIMRAAHPTYQLTRDGALNVEKQRALHGSKQ